MNNSDSYFRLPLPLTIAVTLFFVAITLHFSVQVLLDWREYQAPAPTPRTLSVEGVGKEIAVPNVARVRLGVQSTASTSQEVAQSNTRMMNEVIRALRSVDVAEKDIATKNYNLQPRWEYDPKTGQTRINGWQLDHGIEVTIRNIDRAGEIIGVATNAGANQVSEMRFEVDDNAAIMRSAREKAIVDARIKAKQIADASGMRLGPIVSYSEGSEPVTPQPFPIFAKSDMAMNSSSPEIQPGEQEVTLNVNLQFEIR